ncbi:MAG: SlyX family protein [Burkholderiaceae bacterium]
MSDSPSAPQRLEARITELEIKLSYTEDLLDTLNGMVARQQQDMDWLLREVARLRQQGGDPVHPTAAQPAGRTPSPLLKKRRAQEPGTGNWAEPAMPCGATPTGIHRRDPIARAPRPGPRPGTACSHHRFQPTPLRGPPQRKAGQPCPPRLDEARPPFTRSSPASATGLVARLRPAAIPVRATASPATRASHDAHFADI